MADTKEQLVKYITIKGKRYPIRVSYYAIKHAQQDTGKSIDNENPDLELYEALFYYALQAGHKIEDKEFTIKREDAEWLLDLCFQRFIELFLTFFPKQPGVGVTPPQKKS